jgi:hypothetical protein
LEDLAHGDEGLYDERYQAEAASNAERSQQAYAS